jgi:6,7-dimethyl-8-ribityllumazine synthase
MTPNQSVSGTGGTETGPTTVEGELRAEGLRFAIVVGRFNSFITERLLEGAIDAIVRCGGKAANIDIVRIPGAWEFPVTVRAIAAGKRHDALICLGAVIRGDTPHFDYVAGEAARGIAAASVETGLPIAFGVLTTNTVEQAIDRAGAKSGNKGFDAAMTAIEMTNLLRRLRAQN